MVKKQTKKVKSNDPVRSSLHFTKGDFTRENLIEGGLIRPAILMASFIFFIGAMFLLVLGAQGSVTAQKWGGSLIIFSFILNLQSIYTSLTDKPSIFRKLNLGFKLVLFTFEILAFNYLLILTM